MPATTTLNPSSAKNAPKILFYNSAVDPNNPITISKDGSTCLSYYTSNPLVSFTNGYSNGLQQPQNWNYFLITTDGKSTYDININIVAPTGYSLPDISFMFTASGGKAGVNGAYYKSNMGGGGGGGGSGAVALVNNYLSGVNSTWHNIKLYPLASYNSVLYLDTGVNNKTVFYAYTGQNGGNGENAGSGSAGQSANGGNGGDGGSFTYPVVNGFPSYCCLVRGGAGGNAGKGAIENPNTAGQSFNPNTVVNPPGSGLEGTDPSAYVPLTFIDGLTGNIGYGGFGGYDLTLPTQGPNPIFLLAFIL
jgi:hypothetical protein